MKILLIGNGGREHAIAWKAAQNEKVEKIYCAPGNGGTERETKCENIAITGIADLIVFAKENKIDLTIVGPEEPLVNGIVDAFKAEGLSIFGPSKEAAKLEGSKAFSKEFMQKYRVKTATSETFIDVDKAVEYLKSTTYPTVIKADGLAAGKGVVICESFEEAEKVIHNFMIEDVFKGAGKKLVIEEFLDGVEASILSITDGKVILPFISAKDHKNIFDGNKGPNTGGMGVISPNPYCNEEILKTFEETVLRPTLKGIQEEKMDYIGIIFFGIMITKKGMYLLEYNVRMGDPETQAVLSLMESDFVELILSALDKKLDSFSIKWKEGSACCVVAASEGYPAEIKTDREIEIGTLSESKIFIAGAKAKEEKLRTTGGRVLSVVATGTTLQRAVEKVYKDIKNVKFEGMQYRKDIGSI